MSLLDTASLLLTPNAYKEGKLYSVIPSDGSGDFTFTRATTATRVNSAGLVELVPYNLVEYSEQIDNSAWTKENATISANAITAPNGTLTADLITSTSASFSDILQGTAQSSGNSYTLSCYAKKGSSDWIFLRLTFAAAAPRVWFNVNTGTIGTIGSGLTATIESVGDGWYRCSITGTASATPPADRIDIALANADASTAPNVGNSVYVWGAQLVEGTLPKDYQKTETRLNIPRLDYSNGTCPSLLVEPQRTNRLIYSEQLIQGRAWAFTSGTFTVTENTTETLDPFGNNNADKFNATTQSNNDSYTSTSGSGNLTISIFAKKGTNDSIQLYHDNVLSGGAFSATFNLTSGTITASSGTASIQDLGNGWYRCSVSGTDSNSSGNIHGVTTYTGTTYLFGVQLEQGSYATSYIPTTSASVTRNADVISKTGISSLIGQTEGTIFGELQVIPQKTDSMLCLIATLSAGTYANFFYIRATNGIPAVSVRKNDTTYVSIDGTTALSEGFHKFAFAYKQNDFAFYVDGVLIGSDTSGEVPLCDEVYLGQYVDGFDREASKKSFALWKTRLTNTQLAALTTI